VVLEDYAIVKEVLADEVWVDRYYNDWMAQRSFGKILGRTLTVGAAKPLFPCPVALSQLNSWFNYFGLLPIRK